MLLFKKKFINAIRCGKKTQTIRFWDRRRMKAGQRSYIPGVGYITISEVQEVELNALTDSDAVLDGFATADDLREELRSIYAESLLPGLRPFRIRFLVFSPVEQQRIREERMKEKSKMLAMQFETRQRQSAENVRNALKKLELLAAG